MRPCHGGHGLELDPEHDSGSITSHVIHPGTHHHDTLNIKYNIATGAKRVIIILSNNNTFQSNNMLQYRTEHVCSYWLLLFYSIFI